MCTGVTEYGKSGLRMTSLTECEQYRRLLQLGPNSTAQITLFWRISNYDLEWLAPIGTKIFHINVNKCFLQCTL